MELNFYDQNRRRFLIYMSFVGIAQAVIYFILSLATKKDFYSDLVFNGVTILILLPIIYLSKKLTNIKWLSRFFIVISMFLFFFFSFSYTENPFILGLFLPTLPLIILFLGGKREGLIWFFVFTFLYLVFYLIAIIGFINLKYLTSSNITAIILTILFYGSVIFLYLDSEEKSKIALHKYQSDLEGQVRERTSQLEKSKADIEKLVEQRTNELEEKIKQTAEINDLMIGRELQMVEMKKEVEKLKEEIVRLKGGGKSE